MKRYRSGRITVDVSDVIDEIEDDDLLRECNNRKLISGSAVSFAEVERAYDYLREGGREEALLILERLVRPKWESAAAAEAALAEARKAA